MGTSGRRFESCCPDHRHDADRICQKDGSAPEVEAATRNFEGYGYEDIDEEVLIEMVARIFRPSKTATQSGSAKTKSWILEYGPEEPRRIEPLMGWTGSGDMLSQVRLTFASKEEAIAYANRQGLAYRLEEPSPAGRKVQSYADNFRATRPAQWTH